MRRDLVRLQPLTSSFLSCEKDLETIVRKLFVESKPYSDELKRLLVIPNKDCLDNLSNQQYKDKIDEMTVAKLIEEGYVVFNPRILEEEFAKYKSNIVITIDNFTPNATNPEFRDCMIHFDVLCPIDNYDLGNYRQRPMKILGYIDGIMNKTKLSGIGELNFVGCSGADMTENKTIHVLTYMAIHGSDDKIEPEVND